MVQLQYIWEKQWLHLILLAGLLAGLAGLSGCDRIWQGQLWGLSSACWFWLAVGLAVLHQVYVWFCWRVQLHAGWITRVFGRWGFRLYATLFAFLGLARAALVFILAGANRGTLAANSDLLRALALLVLVPALYLVYSVLRYFSLKRALGMDHFDESYRRRPLVRQGIFKFSANAMYAYGFLLIWVPGLWCASLAALILALFNHLYIWVHYWTSERPDIQHIYTRASLSNDLT